MATQCSGQPSDEGGEHGPVRPLQTRFGVGAAHHRNRLRGSFDIGWWVPAEDPTLVPDHLMSLACALDLARPTDRVDLAVARLRAAGRSR
jgi:hypothetical protein